MSATGTNRNRRPFADESRAGPHGGTRLRDIAQEIGCSVNTVSRALSNKPDVSPETRARVHEVAARLHYTPNLLARALVSRQTHTLGLVVADCTNPYYGQMIRGVEAAATRAGYALLLATSDENPDKERRVLTTLRERRVDGLLIAPIDGKADYLAGLASDGPPQIYLSRPPEGFAADFVANDNRAGATMAVGHLVELGHRTIVHVAREGAVFSALEREAGYLDALQAAGIEERPRVRVTPDIEGGRQAARSLLEGDQLPEAVFAYNDLVAIGLMSELAAAGRRVPQDVSVVGYDDIEPAGYVQPRLTTIAQGTTEIGRRAAELLVRRIERGPVQSARAIVLPPSLVVRDSTAAPRRTSH
ncbi:MAG: LacI family transcriptional regulator [Chloroflexota bacterium]|nr:LacI family transcriptional regulator [Chloroflexota bacterium]